MKYYIAKTIVSDFDEAIERITKTLKTEGFGIISEIDMQSKLKEKLNVDFRRYMILGACNPTLAHKALLLEDKIGTLLPCNIIVQELADGKTEVAAVNPVVSMQGVKNNELEGIAGSVYEKLERAIKLL